MVNQKNTTKKMKGFHRLLSTLGIILMVAVCFFSCKDDNDDENSVDTIVYEQTPFIFDLPTGVSPPNIPADNPMTTQGVELGRMLFYDPILSGDNTMACASCHVQEFAFTDPRKVSIGIDNVEGSRNSMPLFNLAFGLADQFTWDGKSTSLEAQSLEPIENPIELHQSLESAVEKITDHADYPLLFRKAFNEDPSTELIGKALAQFTRSIVSFDSKWDKWVTPGSGVFPDDENYEDSLAWVGYSTIYEGETGSVGEAECLHCHGGGRLLTDNQFKNNGLDCASDFTDFADLGKGGVSGDITENGFFKTPSLRNIALTAPYMHDGRFQTLEEVIDHYSEGGCMSPTISSELGSPHTTGQAINFTPDQKAALLAWLHSLTDSTLITNPAYSNPF